MTKQEMILKALNTNVNLSDEEYRKVLEKADNQTAINGATKLASRSETTRARRMHMNFMGSMLNIMLNIMVSLEEQGKVLEQLLAETKTQNELLAKALGAEIVENAEEEPKTIEKPKED